MNNLSVRNSFFLPTGQEMQQMMEFCKTLSSCDYYRKMGPGGVLAIYLTAREMNLPLMACLNGGMYTFSGAVSLSAKLMNMMIHNVGHRVIVLHLDEKSCKLRFWRNDTVKELNNQECEYTIEMAQKAGYLSKDNWKKHTRNMLYARCLSEGARMYMSDVIMGAYVVGELGDEDGEIIPIMPDLISEMPPKEENKEIKMIEKDPGYDEFCLRYAIFEGMPKYEYIKMLCIKKKQTEIEMINYAMKNEERFIQVYEKWTEDQEKKNKEKSPSTST